MQIRTPFLFDFVTKYQRQGCNWLCEIEEERKKQTQQHLNFRNMNINEKNINSYHIIIASQTHTYTHLCGLIAGAQTSFALIKIGE